MAPTTGVLPVWGRVSPCRPTKWKPNPSPHSIHFHSSTVHLTGRQARQPSPSPDRRDRADERRARTSVGVHAYGHSTMCVCMRACDAPRGGWQNSNGQQFGSGKWRAPFSLFVLLRLSIYLDRCSTRLQEAWPAFQPEVLVIKQRQIGFFTIQPSPATHGIAGLSSLPNYLLSNQPFRPQPADQSISILTPLLSPLPAS